MKNLPAMKKAQVLFREITGRKPKLNRHAKSDAFSLCVGGKAKVKTLLVCLLPHLIAKQTEAQCLLRALDTNEKSEVDLLKSLKHNPEPSPKREGVEIRPGTLFEEELGWLAGILDGDGCVSHTPPEIKLEMASAKAVRKAAEIAATLSASPQTLKARYFKNPKWRPTTIWRTRNRNVIEAVVVHTYEQLTEKREAALAAILRRRNFPQKEGMIQVA